MTKQEKIRAIKDLFGSESEQGLKELGLEKTLIDWELDLINDNALEQVFNDLFGENTEL